MIKKVGKVVLWIVLSLAGILFIGFLFLVIKSPGKLDPLKDANGQVILNSLSEKNAMQIGGIQQGFFIRSENTDNPVILYLHGGPGSPELPFLMATEQAERLEKYFTVCYWDQRGAGMSFDSSIDTNSMSVASMVEDTHEMTKYLQKRFKKDKIYLMGHSWGSFLGIKTIEKYPENYFAYIGIGQVTNQLESERLAYDYMLQHATEINDDEAVKQLKQFDKNAPDFPSIEYLTSARMMLMNKYGIGMVHENASMSDMVNDLLLFEGYTLPEKINYVRGSIFSLNHSFNETIRGNLFDSSTSFKVPVYITHGKYDYQVSYDLAKKYIETIDAPRKGLFTFDNSAHSPNMEEPDKFVQIIRDIAALDSVPVQ